VIDRPPANAIDAATSRRLAEVFTEFRDDPSLRVAILSGSGDRFFCAGWDLGAAAGGEGYEADFGPGGFGGFPELPGLRKPVICAVNGLAVGGGFEIVLAAHLVIAADHAEFFFPEAHRGIIPDAGTVRLARLLPPPLAFELLVGARRLRAGDAAGLGLINRVVPGAGLAAAAEELAGEIVAAAPLAVAAIIELMEAGPGRAIAERLAWLRSGEAQEYRHMLDSDDAREGPAAFVEKRPPQWKGR
jgi:crotonobetainyl-CoA hydratase